MFVSVVLGNLTVSSCSTSVVLHNNPVAMATLEEEIKAAESRMRKAYEALMAYVERPAGRPSGRNHTSAAPRFSTALHENQVSTFLRVPKSEPFRFYS